jgi:hypothetical protein
MTFWAWVLGTLAALFFGRLWVCLLIVVTGSELYTKVSTGYLLRLTQPAPEIEQAFPTLCDRDNVSIRLDSEPGKTVRGGTGHYLGQTYVLLNAQRVNSPSEIDRLSKDELRATIAHELGHVHHQDTLKRQIVGRGGLLVTASMMWVLINHFDPGVVTALLGAVVVLQLILGTICRNSEYRADQYAVDTLGSRTPVVALLRGMEAEKGRRGYEERSLLQRLSYLFDSHPTPSERLAAINGPEQAESGT